MENMFVQFLNWSAVNPEQPDAINFCVEFFQDMEGVKWNQYDLGQHLMIYCLANLVQSKCVSKHA